MQKKYLFTVAAMAAFAAGSALALPQQPVSKKVTGEVSSYALTGSADKVVKSEKLAKGVALQYCRNAAGMTYKRLAGVTPTSINPFIAKAQQKADADGISFFEDFEAWDGEDYSWLPDGWQRKRVTSANNHDGWIPYQPDGMSFASPYGKALIVLFSPETVDEWAVTPEIEVEEGMELTWNGLNDGVWYFDMSENVDWDTFEYIKQVVICDVKINVSTDGGNTWTVIKSLSDDFIGESFMDLYMAAANEMKKMKVSLDDYAGKKVKIGFQYVGTDGNTSAIDNVRVGLRELDLSYMNPAGSLHFGLSRESSYLPLSVIAAPAYAPITFTNTSYNEGATYSWTYLDNNAEEAVSNEQDELTISYTPDYTSEFSTRNNVFNMPQLHGTAPGASATNYNPGGYLQAGGTPDWEFSVQGSEDKVIENLGLTVNDISKEGVTTIAHNMVPIFGYNQEVDKYWSEYTFSEDYDENNWVKYHTMINVMLAPESPMVIDGVWTEAYARVKTSATFKVELRKLTEEGEIGDLIASATATGDDLLIISAEELGGTNDFLTVNFKFDEPVVISNAVADMYVVCISGFNDPENVEYFSPLLSESDSSDGMAYGWILKDICMDGNTRSSLTAVVNYTGVYQAFYIMLDASYPWLESADELTISPESPSFLKIDTYHPAEKLTVENLPSWLTAEIAGRYDNAYVKFTSTGTETDAAEVTVKGPGVSKTVKISYGESGIDGIEADTLSGTEEIYTLTGRKVGAGSVVPGIYVVRHADGSASKVFKR